MIGYIASVLLAVLTHELAHLIVMRILGVGASRVRFGVFGIGIEAKYALGSYLKQAVISLAGSALNIVCAVLLRGHTELAAACFAYGLFNLLPLSALDGGELVYITLAVCGVPDRIRYTVSRLIDTAMTALLWIVSVYLALNGVGEGLLVSSLYMVFSRICFTRS